ncbi:hypothetical protein ABW19_dt0201121 [Dactylella cylindrospora]|nr:hypothetical protein ABW19_dt0201121 [Dactylella cylindrospora]
MSKYDFTGIQSKSRVESIAYPRVDRGVHILYNGLRVAYCSEGLDTFPSPTQEGNGYHVEGGMEYPDAVYDTPPSDPWYPETEFPGTELPEIEYPEGQYPEGEPFPEGWDTMTGETVPPATEAASSSPKKDAPKATSTSTKPQNAEPESTKMPEPTEAPKLRARDEKSGQEKSEKEKSEKDKKTESGYETGTKIPCLLMPTVTPVVLPEYTPLGEFPEYTPLGEFPGYTPLGGLEMPEMPPYDPFEGFEPLPTAVYPWPADSSTSYHSTITQFISNGQPVQATPTASAYEQVHAYSTGALYNFNDGGLRGDTGDWPEDEDDLYGVYNGGSSEDYGQPSGSSDAEAYPEGDNQSEYAQSDVSFDGGSDGSYDYDEWGEGGYDGWEEGYETDLGDLRGNEFRGGAHWVDDVYPRESWPHSAASYTSYNPQQVSWWTSAYGTETDLPVHPTVSGDSPEGSLAMPTPTRSGDGSGKNAIPTTEEVSLEDLGVPTITGTANGGAATPTEGTAEKTAEKESTEEDSGKNAIPTTEELGLEDLRVPSSTGATDAATTTEGKSAGTVVKRTTLVTVVRSAHPPRRSLNSKA